MASIFHPELRTQKLRVPSHRAPQLSKIPSAQIAEGENIALMLRLLPGILFFFCSSGSLSFPPIIFIKSNMTWAMNSALDGMNVSPRFDDRPRVANQHAQKRHTALSIPPISSDSSELFSVDELSLIEGDRLVAREWERKTSQHVDTAALLSDLSSVVLT